MPIVRLAHLVDVPTLPPDHDVRLEEVHVTANEIPPPLHIVRIAQSAQHPRDAREYHENVDALAVIH